MNVPLKIARRYFLSRISGGSFNLISVISGISLLGYIVGAAALVVVLSVFNGFEDLFSSLYNNFDPDMEITAIKGKTFEPATLDLKKITSVDGVWKHSEILEENILIRYDERQNIATAKGVDENFVTITSLDSCMVAGDKLLQQGDTDYALVGQGLAYQLSVDPTNYFKRLVIYVPRRGETDVMNPEGSFSRAAIYPSGIFTVQQEVDNKYVVVPLRFLRKLLDIPTRISSIEIKLIPGADVDKIKKKITELCGSDFIVKNRFEQREAFFKVMKSEKLMSYLILFFILLVAASNTIGSLYILVIEKKKDLKMMAGAGLSRGQAAKIFVYESLMLAMIGGISGILLGLGLCYLQQQYGFVKLNEAAAFVFQAYPVKIKTMDIALVLYTVILLGFLTSVYPASKARQIVT